MYCVKKITDDLTWIGGNDRRLALFEGVYASRTACPTIPISLMTKRPWSWTRWIWR